MKVYVLVNKDDEILAFSHEESMVDSYYNSLEPFIRKGSVKFTVTKKKVIEELEYHYHDRQLFGGHGEGIDLEIVDIEQNKALYKHSQEEYDKLRFLVKDIKNIEDNYSISKKDREKLKKARKILKELQKSKNFKKATGMDTIEDMNKQGLGKSLKRLFNIKEDDQ